MEQRIGSITPSVHAAGIDPAFIPGLTPPAAAEGEEEAVAEQAEAEEQAAQETPASTPEAAEPEPEPEAEAATGDEPSAEAAAEAAEETAEDEEDPGEPDFQVSDRRGSITADRVGVRFTLDEEEADFHWDEIGAVEIDTPRFGRRFTVTVYTGERRWYEAEVEAPSRSALKEWAAQLDAVLDAHFEDAEAVEEAEAAESADGDATAEAAEAAEAEEAEAAEKAEESGSADEDEAEADAEAKADDDKGSLKKA